MILHKHKLIFIHIIKCGGTSVKRFFRSEAMHRRASFYNVNKFNNYFKFAFVRNPWDKMVSQYFYIKSKGRYSKTFEEFIDEWKACPIDRNILGKGAPIYYQPVQSPWLTNKSGDVIVDYVGRFESFQEDFNMVLEKIDYKGNRKLPHVNKTKHLHYSTYYNEETRRIVEEKFSQDIELFGYKFENP